MANSGEELLKDITVKVVRYMNTPKEIRNKSRQDEQHKETWETKWFGMVPIAVNLLFKRTAHKDKET
ncbi:YqzE family protein [Chengkuizengella axinellae]|uniref:YqzE family protein n=1 Tax=Chengkuizengella axinellae TaxID=3064388 RepID=A0ABT9IYZ8_9BACL|nr:YqzE family protein [Chengkuizengella sp. 2205SS18-9]MDP5274583.1 YqzE family protein [Chengkuizengella sp. 2205SS18-9]